MDLDTVRPIGHKSKDMPPSACLAHVNNIPVEILSSMFTMVVDASLYARASNDKSYGSSRYPMLVSSVCRHWRHVAIGTPQIWTHVEIYNGLRDLDLADLFLKRSANLPLRIRLGELAFPSETSPGCSEHTSSHVKQTIMSMLCCNAPRLQSLVIYYTSVSSMGNILSTLLPLGEGCALQELALRLKKKRSPRPWTLLSSENLDGLFEPLRVLHLRRIHIKIERITSHKLVELVIYACFDVQNKLEIANVLNSNPGLRFIRLDLGSRRLVHNSTKPINLPNLRNLELSAARHIIEWLFMVMVPGPHELSLKVTTRSPWSKRMVITDAAVEFFQRVQIKSLHIVDRWLYLPLALQALPRLEHLRLSRYTIDWLTFVHTEGWGDGLSKLHTIDLFKCNIDDYLGLHVLTALPSVLKIRHYDCGWPGHPRGKEGNDKLQPSQEVSPKVTVSPELCLNTYPSPFY